MFQSCKREKYLVLYKTEGLDFANARKNRFQTKKKKVSSESVLEAGRIEPLVKSRRCFICLTTT